MDQENHQQAQADDARYAALADEIEGKPDTPVEPEPKGEDRTPPEGKDKPSHTVPLATFLEQKNEVRRLKDEMAAREQQFRLLDERINILNSKFAEPAPQAPDKEKDPLGWQEHQIGQTKAEQAEIKKQLEQVNAREAERQRMASLSTTASADERRFAATKPDYWDAVKHYFEIKREEAAAMGLDPAQTSAVIAHNVTIKALKEGKSPAEEMYRLALRNGYVSVDGGVAPNGEGKSETEKKLETVARGLANKSLAGPGGAARGKLTVDRLRSMTDSEFDSATKGDKWKQFWVQ